MPQSGDEQPRRLKPPVQKSLALKPFVKWAGGKSRLVPSILARLPESIGTYYEPFVGGAAVFFALAQRKRFKRAVLSDLNAELVDVYRAVKSNVKDVVSLLSEHAERHDSDHYYAVRKADPKSLNRSERAARLIYLNKTGYNGLYRVNRAGQFNVPLGRYTNPTVCDEPLLRAASRVLRGVQLEVVDFEQACAEPSPGDAVYFDPPYVPLSKTSSFTAYHSTDFGEADHRRLAEQLSTLKKKRIAAVLSNSDTALTRELFERRGLDTERVWMTRSINSSSTGRGEVAELLVSNQIVTPRSPESTAVVKRPVR